MPLTLPHVPSGSDYIEILTLSRLARVIAHQATARVLFQSLTTPSKQVNEALGLRPTEFSGKEGLSGNSATRQKRAIFNR